MASFDPKFRAPSLGAEIEAAMNRPGPQPLSNEEREMARMARLVARPTPDERYTAGKEEVERLRAKLYERDRARLAATQTQVQPGQWRTLPSGGTEYNPIYLDSFASAAKQQRTRFNELTVQGTIDMSGASTVAFPAVNPTVVWNLGSIVASPVSDVVVPLPPSGTEVVASLRYIFTQAHVDAGRDMVSITMTAKEWDAVREALGL